MWLFFFRDVKEVVYEGYRFTGRSYANLKTNYNFQTKFDIKLDFNTFKPDGLLLLMFDEKTPDFASLDIRQGHLVYQYDLGSGRAFIKSTSTFNDGKWHKVTIKRRSQEGIMFVDNLKCKFFPEPIFLNQRLTSCHFNSHLIFTYTNPNLYL